MNRSSLESSLSSELDSTLTKQLLGEFTALERSFLLKQWSFSQLTGGRFCEVAARIVYSIDSGNINLTKTVDDCLRYIDNEQVTHNFPERQGAIHIAKVLRAIYKLRSQRGAVHVSPTYTANEIDSRLIIESARWVFSDLLRLFATDDPEEIAVYVKELSRFPHPMIRKFGDRPLLQSAGFTTEEEILILLQYAGDEGLDRRSLNEFVLKDASGISRALKSLSSGNKRQIVMVEARWVITDLGLTRIEPKIADLSSI